MGSGARWGMCALILLFSLLGVLIPFMMVKWGSADVLESSAFNLLQCISVGLICGVAFLHIFADAQEDLAKMSDFPIAGTFLLMGCFTMVATNRISSLIAARYAITNPEALESSAANPLTNASFSAGSHVRPISTQRSGSFHGHVHQRLLLDPSSTSSLGARIRAYLLEAAIAVHSILVGLGVGLIDERASPDASFEVFVLGTAVCFHQLFEGIAVGSQGVQVGLAGQSGAIMIVLFTLSCPMGGLLGILISSHLDTESEQAHWILGSLNAFAAGTLIEIGCVDLLPELFSHKHGSNEKISLRNDCARLLALVFGSGVMAVLAIWA